MAATNASCVGEIMLFGVRVVVDSMRKSVSLNNLSQYEHPSAAAPLQGTSNGGFNNDNDKDKDEAVAAGYASADDARRYSSGPRSERKRGVPWTEEEHKLFLIGLQKVGKGDWRGISRNFVKTRTPTQVASHAQKYFLRRLNINRRRRRSSLFDITTDTVTGIEIEEQTNPKEKSTMGSNLLAVAAEPTNTNSSINNFPAAMPKMPAFTLSTDQIPHVDNLSLGQQDNQCIAGSSLNLIRPVQHVDDPSSRTRTTSSWTISDIDLNLSVPADPSPFSLNLSSTSDPREPRHFAHPRHFAYRTMANLSNNGDSIISVA